MSAPTKIDVSACHADRIRAMGEGVQPLVAKLLEKYLSGSIVLLNAENQAALEKFQQESGAAIDYTVNYVLSMMEYEIPKQEKIKITIGEKIRVKKKIKITNTLLNP
jgi:hypothetical protein